MSGIGNKSLFRIAQEMELGMDLEEESYGDEELPIADWASFIFQAMIDVAVEKLIDTTPEAREDVAYELGLMLTDDEYQEALDDALRKTIDIERDFA